MASGDVINYSVRPAKTVERKIIKDIFSNLNAFIPLNEYRYIGFGSKYFSDFKIFHKELHIEDMISIEDDEENKEKYIFNNPFDCIQLNFGKSTDVLTDLIYEKPFICWLDYDYALEQSVIDDLDILLENLPEESGSVISISLNVRPYRHNSLKEELKKEGTHSELLEDKLQKIVEKKFIPFDLPKQGLNKADIHSEIIRQIITNKILNKLKLINSALEDSLKWEFKQIFNFLYKDGAEMGTWGWLFYKSKDQDKFEKSGLEHSEFYSSNEQIYTITIPNLTIKEINQLLEKMPLKEGKEIDRSALPGSIYSECDIYNFSKIYKYFPSFVNAEFG
ncbi:hypothetical protein MHM98_14975 [Psychrobium sp. MM17-31]|uniref:O-methyltransferase n=1 Tax=Psychrobium sp. MM17-31 TaxID=2917758 RepID=UPI001EF42330|nr:O-methyltransferase [Psychrobium sp. MM17-31]MCG7532635.1 hypothetical protein [Psychrobium sp. MM17-31]